MPADVFLTILLVLGFVVAACAVTAVVAWVIVLAFRAREARRGPGEGSEQSAVVADGLFELDGDGGLLDDPAGDDPRAMPPSGSPR